MTQMDITISNINYGVISCCCNKAAPLVALTNSSDVVRWTSPVSFFHFIRRNAHYPFTSWHTSLKHSVVLKHPAEMLSGAIHVPLHPVILPSPL